MIARDQQAGHDRRIVRQATGLAEVKALTAGKEKGLQSFLPDPVKRYAVRFHDWGAEATRASQQRASYFHNPPHVRDARSKLRLSRRLVPFPVMRVAQIA